MNKDKFDFRIELRSGIEVLVWDDESCRPANEVEIAMWNVLSATAEPAEEKNSRDEKAQCFDKICDLLQIGELARSTNTVLQNITNCIRRENCLSALEREFFMNTIYEDGEEYQECMVSWGANPEEYVKQAHAQMEGDK